MGNVLEELILQFEDQYKLAHHIPGRFRVKFNMSVISNPWIWKLSSQKIDEIKNLVPGFTKIRINLWAKSLIVEYDRTRISPELIDELFSVSNNDRRKQIIEELSESSSMN